MVKIGALYLRLDFNETLKSKKSKMFVLDKVSETIFVRTNIFDFNVNFSESLAK